MSKDYTKELNEMYRLMNYGMNESKKTTNQKAIVEYSQLGADGKTYGILKEGTKYFVKVAPKKNTEILAEDYDYVGGFNNRKSYESYTKASNALNLHLISLNEAKGGKNPVKSQFNLNESAEWKNTQTNEARTELNRFYQLVSRVDNLLNENVHYVNEEIKQQKLGKNSKYDKMVQKGNDSVNLDNGEVKSAETARKTMEKGTQANGKYEAASGINSDTKAPFTQTAKTSKEQGKTVANESRRVKLSEEQGKQVLAWRDDRAFVHNSSDSELDRSHGTKIGDTAPWTDNVNEDFGKVEWDVLPGQPGVGDAKQYKEPFTNKKGVRQPVSEEYIFEVTMDGALGGYDEMNGDDADNFDNSIYAGLNAGMEDDLGDTSYEGLTDGISDDELQSEGPDADSIIGDLIDQLPNDDESSADEIGGYDDTDAEGFPGMAQGAGDSIPSGMGNSWDDKPAHEQENLDEGYIFEVTLNDFGKHPAYRKKPMTLPQNGDGSQWGEDWNDESTKGEQPYGRQIGHSGDPFTDKVNAITNAVVTALSKKKD